MKNVIEHVLVIWYSLAHIVAGLIGVLSLGFYVPSGLPLKAVTILARYREHNGISRRRNGRKK